MSFQTCTTFFLAENKSNVTLFHAVIINGELKELVHYSTVNNHVHFSVSHTNLLYGLKLDCEKCVSHRTESDYWSGEVEESVEKISIGRGKLFHFDI